MFTDNGYADTHVEVPVHDTRKLCKRRGVDKESWQEFHFALEIRVLGKLTSPAVGDT
jgi:hypothetical protein